MSKVCDYWPEGMLTPELFERNIDAQRKWYGRRQPYTDFIDEIAKIDGLIVDVASGPGGSVSGGLVPLLDEQTHFVMSDAARQILHGLKAAWSKLEHRAKLDYLAFDGNQMPFGDETIDAFTAYFGFMARRMIPPASARHAATLPIARPTAP